MARKHDPALFGPRFARALWRLGRVYWTSSDAKIGSFLLTLAVALELGTVWSALLVADGERRILDALAQRDSGTFLAAVSFFVVVTLLFVFASAYRIYARQAVEIRWRRALTSHFVERWITPRAAVQAELYRHTMDNPEQRIQEDVRDFVASALGLSLSMVAAVATLVAFGDLLWGLSAGWPLVFDSTVLRVPGLMLWVALAYGLVSMWVTHLVGRRLVPINFDRLRFEADFRYGLTRFRDNADAVAVSHGTGVERRSALKRFRSVLRNWWQLIRAQRNLTLLTGGIGQANSVVPVLVAAPAYFGGLITLGAIAQIRIAYGQVSGALAWFVFAYQEIARWRANVERLITMSDVMDTTERQLARGGIVVVPGDGAVLRLDHVSIEDPDGRILVDEASGVVHAGERVAITGPSGAGKTILLRTIAGIWPFGAGRIEMPAPARMIFVPQWPYMPVGTLAAAASYPAAEGAFSDERIGEALAGLGLEHLVERLHDVDQWDALLSPHEQQRLALVRVLLHEPDWIFLDKATSALDEAMERRAYELLAERLPDATIVSVAHRPLVARYHARHWTLAPHEGRVALRAA
jgi:putative ATP-binding cassette transporter